MPEVDAELTAEQAASAALTEAEDRGYGTSEEDVQAYAGAAGAVAGAAACSAVGAAAAAPLCAMVAGAVTEWVAGVLYDWFTDDEALQRSIQRRADVRAMFASMALATELDRINQASFNQTLDDLLALYQQVWGEPWEAGDPSDPQAQWMGPLTVLRWVGAPIVRGRGVWRLASVFDYWQQLTAEHVSNAEKERLCTERASEIYVALEAARNRVVIELGARAGTERAVLDAQAAASAPDPATTLRANLGQSLPEPERWAQLAETMRQAQAHEQARPAHPFIGPAERSWPKAAGISGAALGAAALLGFAARRVA